MLYRPAGLRDVYWTTPYRQALATFFELIYGTLPGAGVAWGRQFPTTAAVQ
jgi:hypothetical protein